MSPLVRSHWYGRARVKPQKPASKSQLNGSRVWLRPTTLGAGVGAGVGCGVHATSVGPRKRSSYAPPFAA